MSCLYRTDLKNGEYTPPAEIDSSSYFNTTLFLNTAIEGSGALAWIGDRGLAPFRYLFNGHTVRIEQKEASGENRIHHVRSFHKEGPFRRSITDRNLASSPM